MSVESILLAAGRSAGEAARAKREIWGRAISDISQIPSQIYQQRQQQQRLSAITALEQAREARARGDEARAQRLEDQAEAQKQAINEVFRAGLQEDGSFNEAPAMQKAMALNQGHLAPLIHDYAQKLKPKIGEATPGTMGRNLETGEVIPNSQVPFAPRAPISVPPGGTLVDPATMKPGFTAPQAPMTPYQQAELGMQGQRLAFDKSKAAQAEADKTELTPEGLDAAALMFSKTGQQPALGMGDKTTRKAIINRAAQLTPGLDIASAKADYGANTATLTQLEKQRAAIGAFEQTASKNIDIFLETAGKVVDTGSPFANTLLRQASGKLLGSTNQAQYDAARQVAINEIAKITSNPTLSGTLSDSARHEVEAFNPQNATLAQSVAVMRLLKRDMQNRTGSLDDQIGAIRERIKKAGSATPATDTAKTVTVTQLEAIAKRRGTTVDQERARAITAGYAVVR
jgi:hypothetical protein